MIKNLSSLSYVGKSHAGAFRFSGLCSGETTPAIAKETFNNQSGSHRLGKCSAVGALLASLALVGFP